MSWRYPIVTAVGMVFAVTSCGAKTPTEATQPHTPRPAGDRVGAGPSSQSYFDRCPVLRSCFGGADAYENCPAPVARFGSASVAINKPAEMVLNALVSELKLVDSIAKLSLIGFALGTEPAYVAAARAKAVKEWLIARGVSETLLKTGSVTAARGDQGYVSFGPQECSGASRDTKHETTPAAILLVL